MADSLHDRILQDQKTLIEGLGLLGLPGVVGNPSVFVEEQDMNVLLPCILLSARGQEEDEEVSDFNYVGVVYTNTVMICDVPRPTFKDAGKVYKSWRHDIGMSFRSLAGNAVLDLLPNVPELFDIEVHYLTTLPDDLPGKLRPVSGLVAHCYTREPRPRDIP